MTKFERKPPEREFPLGKKYRDVTCWQHSSSNPRAGNSDAGRASLVQFIDMNPRPIDPGNDLWIFRADTWPYLKRIRGEIPLIFFD